MKRLDPPFIMFLLSLLFVAFGAGLYVGKEKVWPYRPIRDGLFSAKVLYDQMMAPQVVGDVIRLADAPAEGPFPRLKTHVDPATFGGTDETFLIVGGYNQFREHCPDAGCAGVEMDRAGNVVAAIAWRPEDILAADMTDNAYPHEISGSTPRNMMRPQTIRRYADGDYFMIFQARDGVFPFGVGAARVAPDGTPRWFRKDFSHHWGVLLPDGRALVPGMNVPGRNIPPRANGHGKSYIAPCESGFPLMDILRIIKPNGEIEREIDLVEAMEAAGFERWVTRTLDPCDPLHLNFVDQVRAGASGGLNPGDFIVSLRNIDVVAILDGETGAVTRLIRGNFLQQHAAQHLSGSKILIYDNWGADQDGPSSQIVEFDVATGVERVIFPRPDQLAAVPEIYNIFGGTIDISPDRRRIFTGYTFLGKAYEIDVETGDLLTEYTNIHGISDILDEDAPDRDKARVYHTYGVGYASD
ncbi:MAG: arylsulfotransferase family protein [Pseudomonadota bacterium]